MEPEPNSGRQFCAHGTVVVYGTSASEHVIPAAFCLTNNISIRFILVYEMSSVETERATAAITKMLTGRTARAQRGRRLST